MKQGIYRLLRKMSYENMYLFVIRNRVYSNLLYVFYVVFFFTERGWSGGAKVLCILHHWGVQLILAYSWARPAILVVGKGRGGMFLFLLFLHFHVPLFHLLYSLFFFSLKTGLDISSPVHKKDFKSCSQKKKKKKKWKRVF